MSGRKRKRRHGAHRRRRAERFLPGRRARGARRRRGRRADQRADRALRECRADAGLASARPFELRLQPSGQRALLHDRDALRHADALAGPLRAGIGGRRVPHSASPGPRRSSSSARGFAGRSTATRLSSRTTARRRPGLPAICGSAASTRSCSPASRRISASPIPRSTPRGSASGERGDGCLARHRPQRIARGGREGRCAPPASTLTEMARGR